jgi:dihydrofolate reductase
MPRRLRYSVAMSLDGFIAERDGGYDWIVMDPGIDFAAFTDKIDTVLMGRHTYEVAGQSGGMGSGKLETIVVSTTLDPANHPGVTIVSKNVEAFVSDLKARDGKDIWLFGGGVLFRSLLEAGLVDRVEVGLIPVLLGEGTPMLPGLGAAAAKLRLHSFEEMPATGTVLLKYDVAESGAPGARRRARRSAAAPGD